MFDCEISGRLHSKLPNIWNVVHSNADWKRPATYVARGRGRREEKEKGCTTLASILTIRGISGGIQVRVCDVPEEF